MNATGFQMLAGSVMPSHAHVHIVDIACDVTVAGLSVQSGDLIHADRHGAVMIPHDAAIKIKEKIELIARKEEVIISAAKKPGFNWEILSESIKKTLDIH